ncbi:SLATT domain-containing protein [Actinoplanes sp. NPDC049118]|uniref:SLATT domain-containing protein n=1 Tax=Actinoplanes sp. NPDC049118 TaxID=3155769 RepID=UPI0033F97CFD
MANRRKRDLRLGEMSVPSVDEWRDPAATLERLRAWAEANASEARDWYLRDKALKRVGSRTLRALAILFAVVGGVAPLLAATEGRSANWGYVMLALAAGCVAFDHFFGLSSGWMRDITTARALERRLGKFRFAWTAVNADAAFGADATTVKAGLELIEQFASDVADLIDGETAEWLTEFRANITNFATPEAQIPPGGDRT